MKIVIDIPENRYKNMISHQELPYDLSKIIRKGTILPKGHGVLKDVTNLMRGLYTDIQTTEETFTSSDVYKMIDEECPTIIDTDKEIEE